MRSCLFLFVLIAVSVSGCGPTSPTIILPTSALTEEQRIAMAQEDAEACNCGKVVAKEEEN